MNEDGTSVEPEERAPYEYIVQHTGPNRAERRAARAVLPDGSKVRIPKQYQEESTNVPYVKESNGPD
jgi:hypothetical protein